MDTDTRTASDHDAGGHRVQRESSWADVQTALEHARQRLRPRWWTGLPEAALFLIGFTAVLSAASWGWLLLLCLSFLIILGRLQPALAGVDHRYPAYGPASATFLGTKILMAIWIVWAIWSVPEGRPLGPAFALALLTVTAVGALELLTQRMLATSLPDAGPRWAAGAQRAALHQALRDVAAVQAMVVLHPTRKMRVNQVADDLGLERAHAQTLLESLERQGLVSLRKKIIDGPDRLWASSTGRGQDVLEAHLAAMTTTIGGTA